MRKFIIAAQLLIAASTGAHAQVHSVKAVEETIIEDTVPAHKADTAKARLGGTPVYLLQGSQEGFEFLTEVLRQNALVYRGRPLTFDEVLTLIQWVTSARALTPPKTEQPKK